MVRPMVPEPSKCTNNLKKMRMRRGEKEGREKYNNRACMGDLIKTLYGASAGGDEAEH